MPFLRKPVVARGFLPAIVLAVVQWACGPADAVAACGDYVHVGGRFASHEGMGEPSPLAERDDSWEEAANAPRRHERPCHGPQCSGETPRPLGAPTTPLKIIVRQWGLLSTPCSPDLLERQFVGFADDPESTCFLASSIYRPPR